MEHFVWLHEGKVFHGPAHELIGATAFIGFYIAYTWDLPVGPTDVVLLGVLYAAASGLSPGFSAEAYNTHKVQRGNASDR